MITQKKWGNKLDKTGTLFPEKFIIGYKMTFKVSAYNSFYNIS